MGRFRAEDADKYGSAGAGAFFKLENDKDVARVRIMYNGAEDIEGYACHEVEIEGRRRYVNCLRDYNQPVDECPFCAAKKFQVAKFYIPLYDVDSGEVKIWERGKKFIGKISSICSRYNPVVNHIFEIERNGKKGDMSTTYEIYEVDSDGCTLEDLPEVPEVLGTVILDKTYEDMETFLQTGDFGEEGQTIRRRNADTEEAPRRRDTGRRTPASGRRDGF